MTRVLSTIASPAKMTRTLLWLSSQRNGSSGLNEGVAIGPRNISSSTGCVIVIPLLPELKNALHGSHFSSDMPRPVPFQTPVPAVRRRRRAADDPAAGHERAETIETTH